MDDHIRKPSVENILRQGDFSLHIFAYRELTREEILRCGSLYLMQSGRKAFPKTGNDVFMTTIGFDLE